MIEPIAAFAAIAVIYLYCRHYADIDRMIITPSAMPLRLLI